MGLLIIQASDYAWHSPDSQKMVFYIIAEKETWGISCSTQKYHTDGQSKNTLASDRPFGKNARNITHIPLFWAIECVNSKLLLDYLKESNENEYLICLLTKLIYHIPRRVEKKIT